MTNQERYITAFRKMEEKYRDPYGLVFFHPKYCELCQLTKGSDCDFCPLFNVSGIPNHQKCLNFPSAKKVMFGLSELRYRIGIHHKDIPGRFPDKDEIELEYKESLKNALTTFENRADFHKAVANLLETLPSKRFTKKGWIGFPEILEIESI